jgi:Uma2 family endonuclease
MKLDEFLHWDDGTDTRYELVRAEVRRRAPAAVTHGALVARLAAWIHQAVKRRPHHAALVTSVLAIPGRDDACYLADIVAAPTPESWGDPLVTDPLLVIEVVSPETFRHDFPVKRPDYMTFSSVREIACIDSEAIFAEVLRREGDQWISEIVQRPTAILSLRSVPLSVPMCEIYEGIPLPETEPAGKHTIG